MKTRRTTGPQSLHYHGSQSSDYSLERNGVRGKLLEVEFPPSKFLEPTVERTAVMFGFNLINVVTNLVW